MRAAGGEMPREPLRPGGGGEEGTRAWAQREGQRTPPAQ